MLKSVKLTGWPPLTSEYYRRILQSGSPRPRCRSCGKLIRVGQVPAYHCPGGSRFARATLLLVHERCLS